MAVVLHEQVGQTDNGVQGVQSKESGQDARRNGLGSMTRWYRAYEGTVTDAKLGEVSLVAGCSRSVAIAAWHCILESAAMANSGGMFDATPRRVAVILGEKPDLIEAVFAELTSLGMICEGRVSAWSKRQYESDSSTQRSRKSRERAKIEMQRPRNDDATLQQQHATAPDTDTEVEEKNNLTVVPKEPKATRKLGTRLPDDFEPDETCQALAEELRMSVQQSQQAFDEFRDYWRGVPGQKGCKLDWQATFRNQLRRVAGMKGSINGKAKSAGNTIADSFAAVDAAIAEAERREAQRVA